MGYRNFCSNASVQKFLCPIVEEFLKQKRDGTTVTVVLKTDDVFADL